MTYSADFEKALAVGRPPNIRKLFPNSRALLVSGKVIDRAMQARGQAITIACNGRSSFVVRGVLRAAQRAHAPVIIEIAKSEGGQKAYCAVNYWNMATVVDALCNELGITVPVAIHADHYGIKDAKDLAAAMIEIPTMFEAGITSSSAAHCMASRNIATPTAKSSGRASKRAPPAEAITAAPVSKPGMRPSRSGWPRRSKRPAAGSAAIGSMRLRPTR